jgi:hypothetical protein
MIYVDEDKYYINDFNKEISPTGACVLETTTVAKDKLPAAARITFDAILSEGEDINETDDDTGEKVWNITFKRVDGGAKDVWKMGIHMKRCPVNPSGHDFFVRSNGSYIGFMES